MCFLRIGGPINNLRISQSKGIGNGFFLDSNDVKYDSVQEAIGGDYPYPNHLPNSLSIALTVPLSLQRACGGSKYSLLFASTQKEEAATYGTMAFIVEKS